MRRLRGVVGADGHGVGNGAVLGRSGEVEGWEAMGREDGVEVFAG